MALWLAIGGALAVGGVVALTLVLRTVNNAVRSFMQQLLGDYFAYASMFYVLALTVVALLVFMYFVVPLVIWLLMVFGVVAAIVALMELD